MLHSFEYAKKHWIVQFQWVELWGIVNYISNEGNTHQNPTDLYRWYVYKFICILFCLLICGLLPREDQPGLWLFCWKERPPLLALGYLTRTCVPRFWEHISPALCPCFVPLLLFRGWWSQDKDERCGKRHNPPALTTLTTLMCAVKFITGGLGSWDEAPWSRRRFPLYLAPSVRTQADLTPGPACSSLLSIFCACVSATGPRWRFWR